jgi:hypothetical protein
VNEIGVEDDSVVWGDENVSLCGPRQRSTYV